MSDMDTLETWCPADGEVVAELRDGAYHCPVCGVRIPRRVLNQGPKPEDKPVRADGGGVRV